MNTVLNEPIDSYIFGNYLDTLIDFFFKILPLKENGEKSLSTYMESLQIELIGCKEFIADINGDGLFLSLISILQYLIDNPDISVKVVKREVFKSISICNKLKARYNHIQEAD